MDLSLILESFWRIFLNFVTNISFMAFDTLFLVLFIIFSLIHVFGEYLSSEVKIKIRFITKPFLLPLLVIYYILNGIEQGIILVPLIIVGLILGFVGDVVLLKPNVQKLFMIGLGSFLIGHILYIIAFFQASNGLVGVPWFVYLAILGYFAFFIFAFGFLKKFLKEMTIPVVIYMSLILIMSFAGFSLIFAPSTGDVKTPWLIFVGSLCFIASDFMLANQLFKKPFKFDQAYIMITYLLAQFCIAQAYL